MTGPVDDPRPAGKSSPRRGGTRAAAAPTWLDPVDVKAWLGITPADVVDDALIAACAAATEPEVERDRPDQFVGDPPAYSPDPQVYQAAVMLAARLSRRRNSPGGVETFADSIAYVARYDPDIQRALHTGSYAAPGVG